MLDIVDLHTHTYASGHAFNTLYEMAKSASEKGLGLYGVSDHGPAMEGAANRFYFIAGNRVPDYLFGVRTLFGIEFNIIDYEGNVDIPAKLGHRLEFVIASMHDVVIDPGTVEQNTAAALNALKKPYIDVIGHPDRTWADMNSEEIVRGTAELGKIIEINNHSFSDPTAVNNCRTIIQLCKKLDVRITLASDAHIAYNVGHFPKAIAMLEEENFPEELIVNRNMQTFEEYLSTRTYRAKK